MKKLLSLTLAVLMSLSAIALTCYAEEAEQAEQAPADGADDFISLSLTEYTHGNTSGKPENPAIHRKDEKDGRTAMKISVNPDDTSNSVITVDGYGYAPAKINLLEYKYVIIDYFYESPAPLADTNFRLRVLANGGVLKEIGDMWFESEEPISAGSWEMAIFDLTELEPYVNPESPMLVQLHLRPLGDLKAVDANRADAVYLGNISFYKEKPNLETHGAYMNGYTDDTFRPSGTMTRAEACTVIARLLEKETSIAGTASYADVAATDWFAKYVGFCEAKGLLASFTGNFLPNQPITRAEFSELVYLTGLAQDKGISASFTDVDASHPRYASIMAAASAGLINGYKEADETYTFKPDNTITRAEVVTIINRARGRSQSPENISWEITVLFLDVDSSHWAFADIAEATIPHTIKDGNKAWQSAGRVPFSSINSANPATVRTVYKLDEGEAKVAELDTLEASRISEIRNTPNMDLSGIAGKLIYVSEDGNDANNGLTEATAVRTINKANGLAASGDAVLLRRGDTFREQFRAKSGVTYTAYGEGAKPMIYGSPENGADAAKWTLVHEDAETGALIWKFHNTSLLDIGGIVFNEGEGFATKVAPASKGKKFVLKTNANIDFDYRMDLVNNLEFFHQANSIGSGYVDPTSARGPIYLRCDNGNPGLIFDSIEFIAYGAGITVGSNTNVTVDNICIKYTSFGISASGMKNLKVTNCEIGWIGGNVQTYSFPGNLGNPTRYGNGIECYGSCDGYIVDNCYIYQCYDAAVTHQISGGDGTTVHQNNVTYSNNVITDCVYSIEYFLGINETTAQYERYGENILFEGNLMRRAGYGHGSLRPDLNNQRHIRSGTGVNDYANFVIRNNVFDRAVYEIVQTQTQKPERVPVYEGNTFIQGVSNRLYSHAVKDTTKAVLSSENAIRKFLGDNTAKMYFVENIPMFSYNYTPSKTVPITDADRAAMEAEKASSGAANAEGKDISAPVLFKTQEDQNLYNETRASFTVESALDSELDMVYGTVNIYNQPSPFTLDNYSMGGDVGLTRDNAIYIKLLMRTNQVLSPTTKFFSAKMYDGTVLTNAGVEGEALAPTTGSGEWETVIVKATDFPEGMVSFSQIHIQLGGDLKGTDFFDAEGNLKDNAYIDIASWAAFTNLASAESFDMIKATIGGADEIIDPDGEVVPNDGESTEILKPLLTGLQKDNKLLVEGRSSYSLETATDSATGIVYGDITVLNVSNLLILDNYMLPELKLTEDNVLYVKMLMRTNQRLKPNIKALYITGADGVTIVDAGVSGTAAAKTKGDGTWEEVIVKIDTFPPASVSTIHLQIKFAGENARGSDFFTVNGDLKDDAYFDIAGWAVFTNLASAQAYDIVSACK